MTPRARPLEQTDAPAEEPDPDEAEDEAPEDRVFSTDFDGFADPAGFGRPYPNAAVEGLLTFRGNPSRSYYGAGPVPEKPQVLYRFPDEPMCRQSVNYGETKTWCGMGWTGQPTIAERDDVGGTARTWAIFGGYDGHIHFMDAATGQRLLPDVETDDIIKGTPTVDPDGFPLVYSGSRDDLLPRHRLRPRRARRRSSGRWTRSRSSRSSGTTTGTPRR